MISSSPAGQAFIAPRVTARPLRGVVGLGLTSLASTGALAIGLLALLSPAPLACGAECAGVLAGSPYAVVLGIPALAWACALHLVLILTTWGEAWLASSPRPSPALGPIHAAQLALVAALLGGSATYLVLGLTGEVRCKLCLAMHALAVVAALGVVLRPRPSERAGARQRVQRIAAVALVLAAWLLAAWGLGALVARHQRAMAAPAASTDKWLAAICQPASCPGAARLGGAVLPADAASIVLGRGRGPALVAWLDLSCAACRADFAAEEPLLRRLVSQRRGARLLLRAPACLRGDLSACEAPAAAICAGRHAGAKAALDYLAWELSAEPGFHTLADRRRTLAAWTPQAARCLDAELALGARGSLGAHAVAAQRLADAARAQPGCDGASPAWWCFQATPSFAIVDGDAAAAAAPGDAFAHASGALRAEVLEQCLEMTP